MVSQSLGRYGARDGRRGEVVIPGSDVAALEGDLSRLDGYTGQEREYRSAARAAGIDADTTTPSGVVTMLVNAKSELQETGARLAGTERDLAEARRAAERYQAKFDPKSLQHGQRVDGGQFGNYVLTELVRTGRRYEVPEAIKRYAETQQQQDTLDMLSFLLGNDALSQPDDTSTAATSAACHAIEGLTSTGDKLRYLSVDAVGRLLGEANVTSQAARIFRSEVEAALNPSGRGAGDHYVNARAVASGFNDRGAITAELDSVRLELITQSSGDMGPFSQTQTTPWQSEQYQMLTREFSVALPGMASTEQLLLGAKGLTPEQRYRFASLPNMRAEVSGDAMATLVYTLAEAGTDHILALNALETSGDILTREDKPSVDALVQRNVSAQIADNVGTPDRPRAGNTMGMAEFVRKYSVRMGEHEARNLAHYCGRTASDTGIMDVLLARDEHSRDIAMYTYAKGARQPVSGSSGKMADAQKSHISVLGAYHRHTSGDDADADTCRYMAEMLSGQSGNTGAEFARAFAADTELGRFVMESEPVMANVSRIMAEAAEHVAGAENNRGVYDRAVGEFVGENRGLLQGNEAAAATLMRTYLFRESASGMGSHPKSQEINAKASDVAAKIRTLGDEMGIDTAQVVCRLLEEKYKPGSSISQVRYNERDDLGILRAAETVAPGSTRDYVASMIGSSSNQFGLLSSLYDAGMPLETATVNRVLRDRIDSRAGPERDLPSSYDAAREAAGLVEQYGGVMDGTTKARLGRYVIRSRGALVQGENVAMARTLLQEAGSEAAASELGTLVEQVIYTERGTGGRMVNPAMTSHDTVAQARALLLLGREFMPEEQFATIAREYMGAKVERDTRISAGERQLATELGISAGELLSMLPRQ